MNCARRNELTQNRYARTSQPIHELLAQRFSSRAFDPDKPLSREVLASLLEAARWAPSCYNAQPWRYLVVDRFADPDNFGRIVDCLTSGNRGWASRAPVLIAVLADSRTPLPKGGSNRWAHYDTGAASQNLCLQARELGLALNQMAGFDADALLKGFPALDGFDPIAIIAIGHRGDAGHLPDWQLDVERSARKRRSLDEIAFDAAGEPLFGDGR